jgi:hypothetical protein
MHTAAQACVVIHITGCIFHLMAFISLDEDPETRTLLPSRWSDGWQAGSSRWLGRRTWIEDAVMLESKAVERWGTLRPDCVLTICVCAWQDLVRVVEHCPAFWNTHVTLPVATIEHFECESR